FDPPRTAVLVARTRGAAEDPYRARPARDGCMTRARPSMPSGWAVGALVLIALVFGAARATAQRPGQPFRVGVLNNNVTDASPTIRGLRAGIKAEGLEEGHDVALDVRSTGSDDKKVAELAPALAKENVDVIVAIGEKETRAAKAAAP